MWIEWYLKNSEDTIFYGAVNLDNVAEILTVSDGLFGKAGYIPKGNGEPTFIFADKNNGEGIRAAAKGFIEAIKGHNVEIKDIGKICVFDEKIAQLKEIKGQENEN
jgi:hypothetical protein